MPTKKELLIVAIGPFIALLGGCSNNIAPVSYQKQIVPIFQTNCMECHGQAGSGVEKSGLSLTSYQNVLKGTKFGPVIKPGDSLSSTLVLLVEGKADPSINMPHGKRDALSGNEITLIKNWIDQGAKNN